MDNSEERWIKLEEVLRKVIREELQSLFDQVQLLREEISRLKVKPKIELVNGVWNGITEDQMFAWAAAYPGVDLENELRRCAAWCVSNPAGAPRTQKARYINSWLAKEQNRAAIRSIPFEKHQSPKLKLCSYCEKVGTTAPNGIWACNEHSLKAMDQDPIPRMRGVIAKPVAGG